MKYTLVTGGAGYIGSHIVHYLKKSGKNIIVLDNLSNGHKEALPKGTTFYKIDLSDKKGLDKIFNKHDIDSVIHLAGSIEVGESERDPKKFFRNNVVNTINLLDAMIQHNCLKLVFSSSAAVYGVPVYTPITEDHPKKPINTYGLTKLMVEQILRRYDKSYGLKYVALRYFNVAGADFSGDIGEDHQPETHLIPLVLQVALKKRKEISVYGTDYPTKDGTAVRDYIHVLDICKAHKLALEYMGDHMKSEEVNLGNEKGYSVKDIIEACRKITSMEIPVTYEKRRAGDPPVLIASYKKAKKLFGWSPEYGINEIISSAWEWHSKHPNGYGD